MRQAACAMRPNLPWIADFAPSLEDRYAMSEICDTCPVLRDCAAWITARLNSHPMTGGYYAGVWLPWPKQAGDINNSVGRRSARDTLRQKARTLDTGHARVLANHHQCVGTSR